MLVKRTLILFIVSFLPLLASCGFSFTQNNNEQVKVTGVSLDCNELVLNVGDTYNFVATIEPNNATDKTVTFSVNSSSVGTINASTGLFRASAEGDAVVTVVTKDGGFTATCEVAVRRIAVTGVTLNKTELSLQAGESYTLAATVAPSNASVKTVAWTTSNDVIATVANDGTVRGVSEGTAIITATTMDGNFTDTCDVTVMAALPEDILELNVVAFNDFHGAIEEDSYNGRMGIEKLGTYLKQKSDEDNTLILSQGDDWQGSIYSNYNRGRLVNDVYAYCRVDARTVGNHDFDWGVEALASNTAAGYSDYVTPVLAANVYDYDFSTKVEGTIHQDNIGVPTIKYTLENGLKVGIVGVIGRDQITSITSSYTQDICFTDHIESVKTHATALREEGCNIVIATAHTGQGDLLGNGLEEYVDLVLCGHTHYHESTVENGLHYYQYGAYGEYIGNIKLTYNTKTHQTTFVSECVVDSSSVNDYITSIDSTIHSLVEQYGAQCSAEANEVLATSVVGSFGKSAEAVNIMCKAIYDQCVLEGHGDVVLTYCNSARSYLPYGSWTYADIYEAFPFDNVVYIESVKGWDIINEVAKYNNVYINPSFDCQINPYSYYKIAVLDYLLYHTNSSRSYDYFYYFDGTPDAQLSINYRLILRKWLKDAGYNVGGTLYKSDYSSSLSSFDRTRLVQA